MNVKNWLVFRAHTLTRRQLMVGAAVTTGLTTFANRIGASTDKGISHTAESIHQEPVFHANRRRVYGALIDPGQFAKLVQLSAAMQSAMSPGHKPAEISQEVGGAFTLFGGHIVGRHIELIPNERIVQAWRVVDWNPGVYSIVRFELAEKGRDTKIVFDHTGFPAGKAQHLSDGWEANYWEPLQKYLSS